MAKGSTAFSQFSEGGDSGEEAEDSTGIETEEGEGQLVDLSAVDENAGGNFPVLPRGNYDAEILEMEYGQSQRSGNNMWTIVWQLTDEKFANADGKMPRQWLYLTFNEGGTPRVKRFLARIHDDDGVAKKLLAGKFDPEKVADEGLLIGAKARLKLNIRRYEGSPRNNIQEVLPPSNEATGGKSGGFANL